MAETLQVASFRMGDEYFGIPTLVIEEFFRPLPVTRVPGADERIVGMVNVRGTTAVVLDMRKCLEQEALDRPPAGEMILLETEAGLVEDAIEQGLTTGEEPVVLLVEETRRVHTIRCDRVHAPPAHVQLPFIEGVVKSDDQYITLISCTKLINSLIYDKAGIES